MAVCGKDYKFIHHPYIILYTIFTIHRGEIGLDYGRIGELRALIPDSVHVMALTATATRASCAKIMQSLHMVKSVTISLSLHKKNILYYVHPKPRVEDFVAKMSACLKELKACTP